MIDFAGIIGYNKRLECSIRGVIVLIERFMDKVSEYEFYVYEHQWDVFKNMSISDTDDQSHTLFVIGEALYTYGGSWENVANTTRIDETKDRSYYILKPEYIELLRISFAPLLKKLHDDLERVVMERQIKEKKALDVKNSIAKHDCSSEIIYDEGGQTRLYKHTITFHDGEILMFSERNIFDFGVFINPMYMISEFVYGGVADLLDGKQVWRTFDDKNGWIYVRDLTNNEVVAVEYLYMYGGFANNNTRI